VTPKRVRSSTAAFEKLLANLQRQNYVLRLYVTGTTPQSARAIENVKRICDQYLKGYYQLQVIDLYQEPELARSEQILAAPTLIKQLPLPVQRVLGDMSRTERVLIALGLREVPD
jgi:circadian clock protein KaiB